MKTLIMIVACVVVAASQTVILMWFLKRLKKIEIAFWGESAKQAQEDLEKARAEQRHKAKETAEAEQP